MTSLEEGSLAEHYQRMKKEEQEETLRKLRQQAFLAQQVGGENWLCSHSSYLHEFGVCKFTLKSSLSYISEGIEGEANDFS